MVIPCTPQSILTIAEDHSRPCYGGGHGGESVGGGESCRSSRTGWGVKWWGYRTGEIIGFHLRHFAASLYFQFYSSRTFGLRPLLHETSSHLSHSYGSKFTQLCKPRAGSGVPFRFSGPTTKTAHPLQTLSLLLGIRCPKIGWLKFKMNRMCDPLGLIIIFI
jgi:hypothetical protein